MADSNQDMTATTGAFPPPRCVLILALIAFDWLNAPLIERLRKAHGTRFVVLGPRKREAVFRSWLTDADRFVALEEITAGPESVARDRDEETALARERERRLGIGYLRDILQQDRGIAVNLLNYTPYSPFQTKEPVDLDHQIALVNLRFESYERLFREEGVDLVLSRSMGLDGAVLAELANHMDIPVTFPRATRIGAYLTWASDAYVGSDWNREVLARTPEVEPVDDSALVTPEGPRHRQKRMLQNYGLKAVTRDILKTTLFHLEFILREVLARKRGKRLNYFSVIRCRLNGYRCYRFLTRNCSDLASLPGPLVFFPLSLDPEYTVQTLSKEFSDTHAIVRQTALSLPTGGLLVVKEHTQIGTRATSFYRDLLQLPNVILADPAIRGIDIVRQADAVVSMNSTASLEAAYMGKRSLVFSCHSELTPLDGVGHVGRFIDLPRQLQWALAPLTNADRDRIRRDAARFQAALLSMSYHAPGVRYFDGAVTEIATQEMDKAVALLDQVRTSQLHRIAGKKAA